MTGASGTRKPDQQTAGTEVLPQRQRRMIYVAMASAVVLVALILVLLGNRGSALQRCKGVLLQPQRDMCLAGLAKIEDNASVCNSISDAQSRDGCTVSIAERTSNATLCGQASAAEERGACVLNVSSATRNPSYCSNVGAPYNSTCWYNSAREDNFSMAQDCTQIGNDTLMSRCTYLYYYNRAESRGNASYCASLPNSTDAPLLTAMFAANFSMALELAAINVTPRSYCYYKLAVQTYNRSLCSRASGRAG